MTKFQFMMVKFFNKMTDLFIYLAKWSLEAQRYFYSRYNGWIIKHCGDTVYVCLCPWFRLIFRNGHFDGCYNPRLNRVLD